MTPGSASIRQSKPWIYGSLISLILMSLSYAVRAQDLSPPRNVLVLYSFSDRSLFDPLDSLRSAVRGRVPFPVNFYAEYMDTQRFEDAAYERSLSEAFRHAYGGQKLDLVMVAAYPALRFALQHRDQIFPGVPIVFSYVHSGRLPDTLPPGVTGVTTSVDIAGSLKLALRLHPTKDIAVVTGTTEFETYWLGVFRREFRPYQGQVTLTELVGLPTDQLMQRLSALSPDVAVFVQLSPQSSKLPVMGTYDSAYQAQTTIAQRFRTYCIFSRLCLDREGIGGSYSSGNAQVEKAAEAASRVLTGEKPDNIPVTVDSGIQVRVDGRQLARWKIPESALPTGTAILYAEPTLWQKHQSLIISIVVFVLLQTFFIAGLLRQRLKKQKIEASLLESEERCRSVAEAAPALIWMSDQMGRVTYLNRRSIEFTGANPGALLGQGWIAYVHPDDLAGVMVTASQTLEKHEGSSKKYRLRRADGVYRWMLDVRAPRFSTTGTFTGFIGSAVDISDQQAAQDALEKLGGRLIDAQEQERRRIARELHDDICQRLAILTLEIEQSMKNAGGSDLQSNRMQEVWQHCSEITGDVQALSHELHSSMLDHLGIVAATTNFCNEFSEQQRVIIRFTHVAVPPSLPRNISLCLFRVTQEALHNAVKHSGVRSYEVELRGTLTGLELEIRDAGKGLDLERVKRNGGLGLISMEERVHLVNGSFVIDSNLNGGTTIRATVPLIAQPDLRDPVPEAIEIEEEGSFYAAHSHSAG